MDYTGNDITYGRQSRPRQRQKRAQNWKAIEWAGEWRAETELKQEVCIRQEVDTKPEIIQLTGKKGRRLIVKTEIGTKLGTN